MERQRAALSFPLATIYASLIEQPNRAKFFGGVLTCRALLIAFAAVLLLRLSERVRPLLAQILPGNPRLLQPMAASSANGPGSSMDSKVKDAAIYFTVVGVTYFVPSSISFSLWSCYLGRNVYQMYLGMTRNDNVIHGAADQHFGGVVAFFLIVLWIEVPPLADGAVAGDRSAATARAPQGRYMPYGSGQPGPWGHS